MAQIISNKVYESLQVPTEYTKETTGTVLYANPYSGIGEVAMPDDLKELMDSDFGLTGTNLLIQLKQKMMGYANGPWYVDSRDGIIYIHNRKFNEEPEHNYTYQAENGEVIRVTFSMQKQTKQAKVNLTWNPDSETKAIEGLSTGIASPESKKEQWDIRLQREYQVAQPDNTMVSNNYGVNNEDYRSHPYIDPDILDLDIVRAAGKKDLNLNSASTTTTQSSTSPIASVTSNSTTSFVSEDEAINNALSKMSQEEYDRAISATRAGLSSDQARLLQQLIDDMQKTGDGEKFESQLKELMSGVTHLFDGDRRIDYASEEVVNPKEFDPTTKEAMNGSVTSLVSAAVNGCEMGQINRGMANLNASPSVIVHSNTLNYYENEDKPGITEASVKVTRLKKNSTFEVPLYKLYHGYFSRYGGTNKVAWAAHANANGGLKNTEKVLKCQMVVVGRPSLQSSQVIYLDNVGKRWSGFWYIKSVNHSMNAGQGYLCTLDLVKNNARSGQSTAKVSVNTQDTVSNIAKNQGKTDAGKSKANGVNSSDIVLDFTETEIEYLKEKYLNKDGTFKDFLSERYNSEVKNMAIYHEVNANNPIASATGTVTVGSTVVSTSGTPVYSNVTVEKIDESTVSPAIVEKYSLDYASQAQKLLNQYKDSKK